MDGDPYRAESGTGFCCPRCAHEGVEVRYIERISISRCERCSGVWVDRAALERILVDYQLRAGVREDLGEDPSAATNATVQPGAPMYVACPRCDELMARRRFASARVVVDVCRTHGAWFDRHELTAAVGYASAHLASIDAVFWPAIEGTPRRVRVPALQEPDLESPRARASTFVHLLVQLGYWLRR